jgi:palmitoyl-protein thioesterase
MFKCLSLTPTLFPLAFLGSRSHIRRASFFGSLAEQVSEVHSQIADIPELRDGYDAIGLSQGGLFLRSLAQSYPEPPMRTLVTLGSPHMGVSSMPPCHPPSFLCNSMHWILQSGVWTHAAQTGVVPAQFFRDQARIGQYLRWSGWLREVNNERWGDEQVGGGEDYLDDGDDKGADKSPRNQTLKDNLTRLRALVLFGFSYVSLLSPRSCVLFPLGSLSSP